MTKTLEERISDVLYKHSYECDSEDVANLVKQELQAVLDEAKKESSTPLETYLTEDIITLPTLERIIKDRMK